MQNLFLCSYIKIFINNDPTKPIFNLWVLASRISALRENLKKVSTDQYNCCIDTVIKKREKTLTPIQILLLILYAFICGLDMIWVTTTAIWRPLVAGAVTGLILGDPTTGVIAGSLVEFTFLGVFMLGGGSVPEASSGTITATSLVITAALAPEAAVAIAWPVAAFAMNFEIATRSFDAVFIHWADRIAPTGNVRLINLINILGAVPWALSRAIPVALFLLIGIPAIQAFLAYVPAIFWTALTTAGALMPACGIAALFNTMYRAEFIPLFLFGFALAAYLKLPMLGIALIAAGLVGGLYIIRGK